MTTQNLLTQTPVPIRHYPPSESSRFRLDDMVDAYELFGSRRDAVLKIAIRP